MGNHFDLLKRVRYLSTQSRSTLTKPLGVQVRNSRCRLRGEADFASPCNAKQIILFTCVLP